MSKILLVEDNELNREMLARRLERRGFQVLLATNGLEGINIAHAELPDLILMDMSLPELDGIEATRRLKADPETQNIPIIVLTAHAFQQDREIAMKAGCQSFAVKPVDFSSLIQIIESLTKQPVEISRQGNGLQE